MISPTIYTPGDLYHIDTKTGPSVVWVTDYIDGYVQIVVVEFHEAEHVGEGLWVTAKTLDASNPRHILADVAYE